MADERGARIPCASRCDLYYGTHCNALQLRVFNAHSTTHTHNGEVVVGCLLWWWCWCWCFVAENCTFVCVHKSAVETTERMSRRALPFLIANQSVSAQKVDGDDVMPHNIIACAFMYKYLSIRINKYCRIVIYLLCCYRMSKCNASVMQLNATQL